jgi:hypothetical protein
VSAFCPFGFVTWFSSWIFCMHFKIP